MIRITTKITRLMYGWSKWGGGNKGLVKEELDEWYCQSCSETQRKGLPSYMVETAEREFVRVCSKCKHKMVEQNLKDYYDLIKILRG